MSVNYIDKSTGDLIRVAGQGKAEYGASTVRKGTIGVPAIAANADYADQTITFSTPMPDTDYLVDLSLQGSNTHRVAFHVVANTKTVNGFTVRFTPIGIKQTTEIGVSGIADNLSYMLTVQRDDVYPNLTKNTALIDPAVSLPTEWNPMQTGYLKNPMPANEATLVYTAFKLYTDTEYNNLLNNAVLTSDVTDEVTSGNMNPVTSNAVYDAITPTTISTTGTTVSQGSATIDSLNCVRSGNIVTISGELNIVSLTTESGTTTKLTLPNTIPAAMTFTTGVMGYWGSGVDETGYCQITNNSRTLTFFSNADNSPVSGMYVRFSITYICQ